MAHKWEKWSLNLLKYVKITNYLLIFCSINLCNLIIIYLLEFLKFNIIPAHKWIKPLIFK